MTTPRRRHWFLRLLQAATGFVADPDGVRTMIESRAGGKCFQIEQLEDRIAPGVLVMSGIFDAVSEVFTPASVALAGQMHAPGFDPVVSPAEQIASLRARLAAVHGVMPDKAVNPGSRVEELLEQVDRHLSDTSDGRKAQVPPHLIDEIDRELEQQGVDGVSFSRVMEVLAEVDNRLTDQDDAPPSASGIIRMLGEIEDHFHLQEPVRKRSEDPAAS